MVSREDAESVASEYRRAIVAAVARQDALSGELQDHLETREDHEALRLVDELLMAVEERVRVERDRLVEGLAVHFPGVGPALISVALSLRDPDLWMIRAEELAEALQRADREAPSS
jgi:hypothetical protein